MDTKFLSIAEISEALPSVSDGHQLAEQLENLTLQNGAATTSEKRKPKRHNANELYSMTTTVTEISNCSATCSHSNDLPRVSKRFRHPSRRADSSIPRKSLDSSSVRKKTQISSSKQSSSILRPRAISIGSLQLSQGRFGDVCRKMFIQRRRRRSFSISSKSSSIEGDISDQQIPTSSSDIQSGIRQKGCGHEATSPDMSDYIPTIENGEVDELAEYFQHFTAIHRKMSAMASSMYV